MDLSNITNSQLYATLIAFFTANFGSIMVLVITCIKQRIKNVNLEEMVAKGCNKVGVTLDERYNEKLQELEERFVKAMENQADAIYKRLKIESEEDKARVEEKSAEVNAIHDDIKKMLEETEEKGE